MNENNAAVMPALDINKLIRMIVDVANGDTTPQEAAAAVGPDADFTAVFVKENGTELIETALIIAGSEGLSGHAFAEELINISERIAFYVKAYMGGEISGQQLISAIGGHGIEDINALVLSALRHYKGLGVRDPEDTLRMAPPVLGFGASMAAYQELRKALDELNGSSKAETQDPDSSTEAKAQIEELCRESVSMIRRYRGEMERVISDYLSACLQIFKTGFEALEKYLTDIDTVGYTGGNAEIQEILEEDG